VVATGTIEAYRQVQVQSRSPLELVVMLYDGALVSLTKARAAAVRGDVRARGAAISKALAIICSLQETLNLAEGGTVAAELDRLYAYASRRLVDATVHQDLSAISEVHKLLTCLRDAWHHIATQTAAAAGSLRP
jgi:flagellar secretion chaperone FliS